MINRLSQILEKKGSKYLESLLNEDIVITEKIDTFRLVFEKKDENLIFYKKDNTPITLIDRILTDIYEDAIFEIPLITKDVQLHEGYYYGVYYTPVERPIRIPYSKLPRYILTDITRRDEKNKVIESLDYDAIREWASVMCMGRPPVLFEGKLTEEQKKLLISYDTNQYDGETMTFAKMIEEVFNASYSKEDIIEGIIIKTKDKIFQVISYEFDILNEAYEKANESRDFYDIIISDVNEFLQGYNIPMLEAESKDELYLNIIYNIFNSYCNKATINESMEAKYLTPPQFGYSGNLNKKLITDKETLEWVNKAPIYEALFKVFVSSFRKYKKPYGLLTESIVSNFNSYVSLINSYINKFEEVEILNEEVMESIEPDYNDNKLFEVRSENIVIDAVKRRTPNDVDNMRVIASIQKAFEPRIRDVNRGAQPCAVYLTTFEPFTNAQMTNMIRMRDMWNCQIILCAVSSEHKVKGDNFYPSDDLIKAQMMALKNANPELVVGFALLESWNITEVFEYCRPDFEPIVIITDKGKKSEMTLQLFFEEEVMGGRINVEKHFNIGELENEDKLPVFRAIEDTNFSLYSELVPKAMLNIWNNILNEYRLWSGAIIKPIND